MALTLAGACDAQRGRDGGVDASCVVQRATIWVSTSDYESGEIVSVDPASRCVRRAAAEASSDTVLARHGRRVLSLDYDRTRDQIAAYVPHPDGALSLEGATSARDGMQSANVRGYLAIDERLALFSRNDRSSLGVYDVQSHAVIENVDLSAFALDAPRAAPFALVGVEGRAFVTLQRWDAARLDTPRPATVVVVDLATRAPIDVRPETSQLDGIDLPFANPFGQLAERGGVLFIPCAGALRTLGDGAIVRVDTATLTVRDALGDERALMGNPLHVLALDDDRLLVVTMTEPAPGDRMDVATTRLVQWSIAQSRVLRVWLEVPEYALTAPVLASDGRVYIGDRGSAATRRPSGLVAFDARTGERLWSEPLALGLPPYSIVSD